MNKNHGGPAFPCTVKNLSTIESIDGFDEEALPPNSMTQYMGMTLRDYIAIEAMKEEMASNYRAFEQTGIAHGDRDQVARDAYLQADAMLRVRK